jgi:broad specificity phosphatase PhoE
MVAEYGTPLSKDRPFAPGGESWTSFEERARLSLRRYGEAAGTTVLVCHTGIIEVSFIAFAGLARRSQRFAMAPRNAAMTSWIRLEAESGVRWRLEVYNDAAHLWSDGDWLHARESTQSAEPFWDGLEPE